MQVADHRDVAEKKLEEKEESKATSDSDIIAIARDRFNLAAESEVDIRKNALDDLKFISGEQWDSAIKAQRDLDRRPCLTINRMPQHVNQVVNDQRQNRPSMKASPVDDKADVETAKVIQGIIRHIEYDSNADVAYDTAFSAAVKTGFGYLRVITEFSDPLSFNQCLKIKRIRNAFSVYMDPNYQEPDGSDANWGFVFENMPFEDYKAQFPNSSLAGMSDWSSLGDTARGWVSDKTVRVAEYFYRENTEANIVLLSNGTTVLESDLNDEQMALERVTVVNTRKTVIPVIRWLKINGIEVLERTDWPGRWIPIIPVLGEELDVDGKRILEGMVRHAKDPQRMYNYWASAETETIALAPRSPWIGYEGQFEGHESEWETANVKNHAFLQVKPISINGVPAPLPQRNVFEPPVQAVTLARRNAADDLKATTGIYDSSLGNRSNETSGIAIQRRKSQTDTANFHFIDNLTRSLRHLGRIMIDAIPKVYDVPQIIRTIGEDGEEKLVQINQMFEENGKQKIYDLNLGKYDITISTGPSYATKRQEAVESMLALTQAYPQVAQVAGDLIVKNMDWQGSEEIAARLKKTLPPGIADDPADQKQDIPPQLKSQMMQMNQMIEQLTTQLNDANHKIETKSIELESKERIEMQKIQANIEIEMAKMGSQESMVLLRQEIAQIENRMNLLGQNQPFEHEPVPSAGPDQAMAAQTNEQQPTGGIAPGQSMGEMP